MFLLSLWTFPKDLNSLSWITCYTCQHVFIITFLLKSRIHFILSKANRFWKKSVTEGNFTTWSMLSCMRHHMINVIMKKKVNLERWLSRKRLLLLLWNVRVQTRNKMLTKVLINIFKWTLTPTLSVSPVPGTPCLLTLKSPAQILGWDSLSPASYYDPIFLTYSHWTKLPILVDDSYLNPPPLSPHMVWLSLAMIIPDSSTHLSFRFSHILI